MTGGKMMKTIQKFYEIEKTNGTNAKKEVLKKYSEDAQFKNTIKWYFDTLIVTGLAEKKLEKSKNAEINDETLRLVSSWELQDLLKYLEENNTGKDENAEVVVAFARKYDDETAEGIYRLATKSWDKGLGIGATTVRAVYGKDFLPNNHKVMLCKSYFDDPDYFIGKKFGIQLKCDGFRMTIIKKGNKVNVFSRSGKSQNGKFPLIEKDVLDAFPGQDVVLDGERMPVGFMEMDSKLQYKLVSNSTKKSGSKDVCLAVYDIVSLDEWLAQKSTTPFEKRYERYTEALTENDKQKFKYLFSLPCMYIGDDTKKIEEYLQWAKDNDKEGVIVKVLDSSYEWDRTMACAKVKTFNDIDLEIIGFAEGSGKHKGRLGAILVSYKGNVVRCGTGFSDQHRDEIWANQENYLGKIAEIVYFEESQNSAGEVSLRFPVFKCIKNGD